MAFIEPKALALARPCMRRAARSLQTSVSIASTSSIARPTRLPVCGTCPERAKIIPAVTGTCAYHQRALTTAIKRARHVALMPYVSD